MKTSNWIALPLLALFGTTAQASEQSGFYAGSGVGLYSVEFDSIEFDESAPTLRLFGGYRVNEFLSVEAGYTNLFEASDDVLGLDVELEGSSLDLTVRPTYPLGERFEAFGILGMTAYDFDVTVSDPLLGSASDNDSDDALLYGLGGAYSLTDRWTLRGEWVTVDVDDADWGIMSVSATYNLR